MHRTRRAGVNGGYELARPAGQITFLEVILVIEGRQSLFECSTLNSKQHRLLAEERAADRDRDCQGNSECLVKKVMDGAEQHLYQYLREHTIQSVLDEAFKREGSCKQVIHFLHFNYGYQRSMEVPDAWINNCSMWRLLAEARQV